MQSHPAANCPCIAATRLVVSRRASSLRSGLAATVASAATDRGCRQVDIRPNSFLGLPAAQPGLGGGCGPHCAALDGLADVGLERAAIVTWRRESRQSAYSSHQP